ncbi:MAG: sialidase family protein [Planctomycetota bacterium]
MLGMMLALWCARGSYPIVYLQPPIQRLDLAADRSRQVVVDRESGQYLGHVSTVLLEDGKTILAVYPKGHGAGEIVLQRSTDGGLTWSNRLLPTPVSWTTSKECPSIHRLADAAGNKRLLVWSGLFPSRFSISEDDGHSWTQLTDAGIGPDAWGGVVVMSSMEALKDPGSYLAWFHDDGRFFKAVGKVTPTFTLYQTKTVDGGLSWSHPRAIYASDQVSLCEPGTIRSPDGKQIAMLLREESRRKRSHVMTSDDEGETWSTPVELPLSLTGDKHTARYTHDGRVVVSFRDHTIKGSITGDAEADTLPGASPTEGDWMLWVGQYDDFANHAPGHDGQYIVRLMDNTKAWDCAYPGLEILKDATIVATTYGHWEKGQKPYIVSVRVSPAELDAMAARERATP